VFKSRVELIKSYDALSSVFYDDSQVLSSRWRL